MLTVDTSASGEEVVRLELNVVVANLSPSLPKTLDVHTVADYYLKKYPSVLTNKTYKEFEIRMSPEVE